MLKRAMLILTVFSICLGNVRADTIVRIEKGEKTPFAGMLMDDEKSNKITVQLLERDLYKELSESYEHSIVLQKTNNDLSEKKVSLLLEQNDKLAVQLQSAQSLNNLERFGFIALGVLTAVLAGFAINGAAKAIK